MCRTAIAVVLLFTCGLAFGAECKARIMPLMDSPQTDPKAAFDVCSTEAATGDAEALYYVSFFYFGLNGFERDEVKAVSATRSSAEKGYPQAQYWMGWQHEIGDHLPQDNKAALNWYEMAASAGFPMAFDRLARAYRNGELGVSVDLVKADHYARARPRAIS
jgi:TPR repeat protein